MPEPFAKRYAAPPPALAFAAQCCRWGRVAHPGDTRLAAERVTDWEHQLRVFKRHRVEGLAWQALKHCGADLPPDVAKTLKTAGNRIAQHNLTIAMESARLHGLFEEAGVDLLFLKGLTLAQLAYGNILTKSGWDLDILIEHQDLAHAADLLSRNGYELLSPAVDPATSKLLEWHESCKESQWRERRSGLVVELHTSPADDPRLIPGLNVHSPRQDVALGKAIVLPTFATDELFAYLMVHGASSAWFRLKWVADLAALFASHTPGEIHEAYRRSLALGAGRTAGLALLMCRWLFGTAVDEELAALLLLDRSQRYLFELSRRNLTGAALVTELHHLPLGTWRIHLTQMLINPGIEPKIRWFFRTARQTSANRQG